MRAVLDRSPKIVAWAAAHIPGMMGRSFSDDATAIGIEREDGELAGAIVFHQWQPEHGTVQVSAAATDPRWLRARAAIATCYEYGFRGLGCHKLWSATPATNKRALRFVIGMGFTPEALLYKHYGATDVVISRLFVWEYYKESMQ